MPGRRTDDREKDAVMWGFFPMMLLRVNSEFAFITVRDSRPGFVFEYPVFLGYREKRLTLNVILPFLLNP